MLTNAKAGSRIIRAKRIHAGEECLLLPKAGRW